MYLLRVSPNSSSSSEPTLSHLAIPKQFNYDGMHMTLIFSNNQFLTTTSNPLNLPANILQP